MKKSGITDSINHNPGRIRIDLYSSLPTEKKLTHQKKVHKKNLKHNILKWMFVYYKCYIKIELTFLKELMLVKQANQKSAMFVTIGIF